jgi:hypothetical protein
VQCRSAIPATRTGDRTIGHSHRQRPFSWIRSATVEPHKPPASFPSKGSSKRVGLRGCQAQAHQEVFGNASYTIAPVFTESVARRDSLARQSIDHAVAVGLGSVAAYGVALLSNVVMFRACHSQACSISIGSWWRPGLSRGSPHSGSLTSLRTSTVCVIEKPDYRPGARINEPR